MLISLRYLHEKSKININIDGKLLFFISIKSNFRFVHIGPILTAFIHGNNSSKLGANNMPNNHVFDAHNVLPISNNETTVILCANALGQSIPATVTLNTVMLQYGFQV